MKKISLVLAIIMLIMAVPFAVLAETDTSESVPKVPSANALKLDETYDFGGGSMFANGYMPSVNAGDSVKITLPFYKNEDEIISHIYVSAAIAANDAAFEPVNTLFGIQHSLAEWKAVFDIRTKSSCVSGVYPVTFSASYMLSDNTETSQTFTVFVRVNGKAASDSEKPVSLPKLMVTGYTASPAEVVAGETVSVSIDVKNMSKRAAYYIELTLSSEDSVFLPKGGTNSAYIDRLKGGETKTLVFDFDVKPDAEPAPASIAVNMKYEDEDVNAASASSVISIPVTQPIRIRVSDASASGYSFDSPFTVGIDVVNMGKSTVYNVAAELTGENFYEQTSYFGGTLAPGDQKQISVSAYAAMMSEEPMQEFSGNVTVTYEDVNGKVFTEEKPFSVTLEFYQQFPMPDDPSMYPDMPVEQPKNLTWLYIAIAAAVVAGAIVFFAVRAKKRRKAIEDELL
ncbi:MAG: hypothetical protein IJD14_05655 [Christensenellaceae bacterium]|nr:hypothetical protein [Christensenellaceae bacterium]